jgi:hypothetical protein
MRYYSYNEYDGLDGYVVTKSEAEIRSEYWPYWYKRSLKWTVDIILKIALTIGSS